MFNFFKKNPNFFLYNVFISGVTLIAIDYKGETISAIISLFFVLFFVWNLFLFFIFLFRLSEVQYINKREEKDVIKADKIKEFDLYALSKLLECNDKYCIIDIDDEENKRYFIIEYSSIVKLVYHKDRECYSVCTFTDSFNLSVNDMERLSFYIYHDLFSSDIFKKGSDDNDIIII